MRRATANQLAQQAEARGLPVKLVFVGPPGYALAVNGQMAATKGKAEKMLRKPRKAERGG